MVSWIDKLLNRSSSDVPATKASAPDLWQARLLDVFKPVRALGASKGRPGLDLDMMSFVVTGEPLAVLQEVGKYNDVAAALRLVGYHHGSIIDDATLFYAHFNEVPAAAGLRLALLLDATLAVHQRTYGLEYKGGIHWPETLMMHSSRASMQGWSSQRATLKGITLATLEQLLVEAGLESSEAIRAAFSTSADGNYLAEQRTRLITDCADYADAVVRHIDVVRPLLLAGTAGQRAHVLSLLVGLEAPVLALLAPELCELAVANSKQVRQAAEPLVRKCIDAAIPALRVLALEAKPDQRVFALRLLWELAAGDVAMEGFVRERVQADKAPSVQGLSILWEQAAAGLAEVVSYDFALPVIEWAAQVTPTLAKHIDRLWTSMNVSVDAANRWSREYHQERVSQGKPHTLILAENYSVTERQALLDFLASPEARCKSIREIHFNIRHTGKALQTLATEEGVSPVVLTKVLMYFELLLGHQKNCLSNEAAVAFNNLHGASGRPGLLELGLMLEGAGIDQRVLLTSYCTTWGNPIALNWPPEDVWPFFAHNTALLTEKILANSSQDYYFNRTSLYRAVATLPQPPANVVNAMFEVALGSAKTDRAEAQAALANHAGKEQRIIRALADGKGDTRAVAAIWLGRLRHAPAIPALEAALQKEKQDVAKGAMLDALQLLGQPVEKYLDRQALAKEADKALAKGLPKDIEWFPFAALPLVRWNDSGAVVPEGILRWMLVQAVKNKSPEPNAVLRKYSGMFLPADREAFGQFVLEAWLQEDIRPIGPDEAMKRAQDSAQGTLQGMQSWPQYYTNHPMLGRSLEEITANYLPGFLRMPAGSATGSKGLLAVAAACAMGRAAPPVSRYLKEFYGTRAAQGKALIAMLAWIEHPTAIQLMLSIGSRFRTKSFQEEATKQASALAERKGWTLAELADRTIPSGGFDETGTLLLSYGQRSFTAKLLPDFKVELFNPDGKRIASLPEPRQDDDAEQAKLSKKAFSAAKKEIKGIVELQTDRLYEALCTGRDWSYEDWRLYLYEHPVMRVLVQRLVWVQTEEGVVKKVFRPLDDGTLSDCDDEAVELQAEDRVRLAHDSQLDAALVARWQQHLVDYEVKPLFQQLGKGSYVLPAELKTATEIKDFEGYVLEAFALRGRALKLGYTRGSTEDGGWFFSYEKRFPTLGLVASVQFTGNGLPEENRTVALLSLSFGRTGDSWGSHALPLSTIPVVLLSECYNDLRLIGAEGSGFASDWKEKTKF